jgi:hypothetical protein
LPRRKWRRRVRRLADMAMAVVEPARYVPPRYDPPQYDEELDQVDGPAPGVRIHQVRRYHRNRLVDFAVTLDRWTDARWQQIARFDCAHGVVHRHRFLPDGRDEMTFYEVIVPMRAEKTLERRFDWCTMMDNEWRDYLKEWTGGVD